MSRGYRDSLPWRAFNGAARVVDHRWGWDRLPRPLGILVLIGVRNVLRRENLVDAGAPSQNEPPVGPRDPRWDTARSPDGTYNDLSEPRMGMANSRFGRNIGLASSWPEAEPGILKPSPRTVSRELLGRDHLKAATTVNSLAAAWLQFMIRDWFRHGRSSKEDPWRVDVAPDDAWPGERPMPIMRTPADPTRRPGDGAPATYLNELTHWWDASSIYGKDEREQALVRGERGRLAIGDRRPPVFDHPSVREEPGFWVGLALLHTLFVREHNAICDRLEARVPRLAATTASSTARG